MAWTASLARSFAWPTALVVVAVLFRRELRILASRLSSASHKGTELRFEQEEKTLRFARAVEQLSEHGAPPVGPLDAAEAGAADEVAESDKTNEWLERSDRALAEASAKLASIATGGRVQAIASTLADYPSAAILAAWGEVEKALRHLLDLKQMGFPQPESVSIAFIQDTLNRSSVVSDADSKTITELRRLRNEVAHGGVEPSASVAIEYAETVDRIVSTLRATADLRFGTGSADSVRPRRASE